MARYIDAGKVIERLQDICAPYSEHQEIKDEAIDIIADFPTADVIEITRAKNIGNLVYGHHCEFKCSRCGADAGEIAYGSMDGAKVNYCPNCGAFIGDGTTWDGTFGGDFEMEDKNERNTF